MANIQRTNQNNTPVANMKNLLMNKGMQEMFKNALDKNADAFMASIIDVYSSDGYLINCDAKEVAMVALKAATLKLPINKELGFAYLVAYKDNNANKFVPQMQIGYKGYVQLAMRTGQYKNLNANIIYDGMEIEEDYLSGEIKITGSKKSDKIIGYFCYFKLNNGFEKIKYMTTAEIKKHAQTFSKTYPKGAWKDNFDSMALKTVTRLLISKYGPMSTEMQKMIMEEEDEELKATVISSNAALPFEPEKETVIVDEETGEIISEDIQAPF